jgi:O-antigen/teichoic acid export membrane protein
VLLKGHTRQHLVITAVGTIVCLGGYIFLIPAFRVWGAVLATTVAFCSIGLIGYWRAQKIHRFEYELRRLAVLLVIACAYCTMLTMIRPGSRLLQAALAGVMIASYPLVLYAARFWDESEREVLRRTERLVWARLRQLITREHTQQLSAEAKLRGEAQ